MKASERRNVRRQLTRTERKCRGCGTKAHIGMVLDHGAVRCTHCGLVADHLEDALVPKKES